MNETRSSTKKSKKRNWIILFSLLGMLLIGAGFLWKAYSDVGNTLQTVYDSVETQNKRDNKVSVSATEPITIALLGIDSYGDDLEEMGGRSDTIIVVTINPKTKETTLVSIPRDSYAEMVGYQTDVYGEYNDKITHAFAYGGTEMSLNSIQEFLNIPIDYYVDINMYGLADLVDALGGIEITSPLTFDYNDAYFTKGKKVTLQGWDALAFARMRYDDPEGDIGREKRQQMVIKAIVDKLLSLDGISNYQAILKSVESNMKTNLSLNDLIDIQKGYSDSIQNYTQVSLAGEDTYFEEIYYYYVNPEERLRVSNLLRDQLGLAHVTEADMNLSDADATYGYGSADTGTTDSSNGGNVATDSADSNAY